MKNETPFKSIPFSCKIQYILWKIGIAMHNDIRNECTPDFNCCNKIGRFAWLRLPGRDVFKWYVKEPWYKKITKK